MKEEETLILIANKGRCYECGDLVCSWFTHDFKRCKCAKGYLDGGNKMIRYGGTMEVMPVYSDAPFEILRKNFYRSGFGKTGLEAFQSCVLENMSCKYLEAILDYPCPDWQKDLVHQEQKYRKQNNIKIDISKPHYHE